MTLRYLLDTSVVFEPVTRRPRDLVIERLRRHDAACAIAAPVWHELVFGCERLPPSKRRELLEAYLSEAVAALYPILPYDDRAGAWHARERARLEATGRSSPFIDGQIAAVAAVHGLVLATANPRDFRPFAGLTVEDWTR